MPDRTEVLRETTQARHDATLRRAEATLRTLVRHGTPITFRAFADAAGVSRSWLYRQPELREHIEQLRQQRSSPHPAVPAAERASVESLRQQIRAYRDEIARLSKENQALYEQLARKLGADRAAAVTAPF